MNPAKNTLVLGTEPVRSETFQFCRWLTDLLLYHATETILETKQTKPNGWTNKRAVRHVLMSRIHTGFYGLELYGMIDFDPNLLSVEELHILNFRTVYQDNDKDFYRIPAYLFPYLRKDSILLHADTKKSFKFNPKTTPYKRDGVSLTFGIIARKK